MPEVLVIDTQKTVLSSVMRIFKTERLIKDTLYLSRVDAFLLKLAESVLQMRTSNKRQNSAYKIATPNGEHAFFLIDGAILDNHTQIKNDDLVFYKYVNNEAIKKKNDISLARLLSQPSFTMSIQAIAFESGDADLKKLYRLTFTEHVNFPLLNAVQKDIVTTEDKNMLVQGVAGSGKTNICIEKIIFSACRAYKGRVLYTTFSRGLLNDTKEKVSRYRQSLAQFIDDYTQNKIVFGDANRKKAIENHLGVYFQDEDDAKIFDKIRQIIGFLDANVDYYLIEDFYTKYIDKDIEISDEDTFLKAYVKDIKNHQLSSKLSKLSNLSYEVIYKEIYGVIFGCYESNQNEEMLTLSEYTQKRQASFSKYECQIIHSVAMDYQQFLAKNRFIDNNGMSRALIKRKSQLPNYSISIIDEVQDMTEVNLSFFRQLSLKMFCVGDALQMINPSYFSFSFLKRLLYKKDIALVNELQSNYRNTRKIAEIINNLGVINTKQFGTHSFVLKGVSVDSGVPTSAVMLKSDGFIDALSKEKFSNYTIIVATSEEKQLLRSFFEKTEILTVAEIKGLERDTVILYNILSDNYDKWQELQRNAVNRKEADENSVYRYYFNLFYVAISRARTHIYVTEDKHVPQFDEFFKQNFVFKDVTQAIADLVSTSNKLELEQDELIQRIYEFIKLGQYDNARFNAERLINQKEKTEQLARIEINQTLIRHGKHREAGIRFWEYSMLEDAKKQFELSDDKPLIDLLAAYSKNDGKGLDINVVGFLPTVWNNSQAKNLVLQTIKKDIESLKNNQKAISNSFKSLKEKKHG